MASDHGEPGWMQLTAVRNPWRAGNFRWPEPSWTGNATPWEWGGRGNQTGAEGPKGHWNHSTSRGAVRKTGCNCDEDADESWRTKVTKERGRGKMS